MRGLIAPEVNKCQTYDEVGFERSASGLVIELRNGGGINLQFAAKSAPGDAYDQVEVVREGEPPAPVEPGPSIDGGSVRLDDFEARIAALVLNTGSTELVDVQRYSTRDPRGAVSYGLRISWHSGAQTYVNVLTAWPSGGRPGSDFDVPDSV
ncbi:hypothetical protein [Streptomyces sp. SID3343]|uniref:hypothetical protein n=1 Tax=Streptomyces sp. SID3343 TaxID=2690260 RepID=UPI00136D5618|nr:hypothetical protein [Streptomyces sp. SID3343]